MAVHRSQPNTVKVEPSARKKEARRQLTGLSVKVSDGTDYGLQEILLPDVTLANAREALRKVPESLARAVIEERQTS